MLGRIGNVPGRYFKGVTYPTEEQRDLFEEAALRLGTTVMEIEKFVRALLVCDGNEDKEGPWFEFGGKVRGLQGHSFSWLNHRVPEPNVKVNLFDAWRQMKADAGACELIMKGKPNTAEVWRVLRNQLAWSRFYAVRFPTPEGREVYRSMVEFHEASIKALVAKARSKRGAQELADALEEMLAPMERAQ
jgi:hypothetical protein